LKVVTNCHRHHPNVNSIAAPSVPVSFLNLNATEIELVVGGDPFILLPLIAPSDAANKQVTWSSSDLTVATVVNGIVVPLSHGKTTITATTADGHKQASCQVYVTNYNFY